MEQSVLCPKVIAQHYLNVHLTAKRDTVNFTFETLFIHFQPALRRGEHKLKVKNQFKIDLSFPAVACFMFWCH